MGNGKTVSASPLDIPVEYLQSVEVARYHLDLTLSFEDVIFLGEVNIQVHVSGSPRNVFYLHSADLEVLCATVSGIHAVVTKEDASSTSAAKIEIPLEDAVRGKAIIDVKFCGSIKTRLPRGGVSLLRHDVKTNTPPRITKVSSEGVSKAEKKRERKVDSTKRINFNNIPGVESVDDRSRTSQGQAAATVPAKASSVSSSAGAVLETQFEPTFARHMFPCIDLPCCKAVFHLTLRGVPQHLRAISNSEAWRVEYQDNAHTANDRREPVKTVFFLPTPKMPTYVFGMWVGDFHSLKTRTLAANAGRTAPLVWCGTPIDELPESPPLFASRSPEDGSKENKEKEGGDNQGVEIIVNVLRSVSLDHARFSLDFTRRAFELFSRLFRVRYPLEKLDVLGLPETQSLGMENFGAITLLQEYMLVTDETTFSARRRIARLICHEVCHQWYGNIVTPRSFDELWLKEGLARFFEFVAVDALEPVYRVWTNFMSEVFFKAMLADSQNDSHPVVQEHHGDMASILRSFDVITYGKGASILRMLCHCVGSARFLEGTRRLVTHHQYACATQEDLWKAVQEVCDRDGLELDVRNLMQSWLTFPAFPVLRVTMSSANTVAITQQPFFYRKPLAQAATRVSAAASVVKASPESRDTVRSGDKNLSSSDESGAPADEHGRDTSRTTSDMLTTGGTATNTQECDTSSAKDDSSSTEPALASRSGLPEPEGQGEREGTRWVVPLRIRAANGPRSVQAAASGGTAVGADGQRHGGIWRLPGEEVRSLLMTDVSTSVTLHSLACDPVERLSGKASLNTRADGQDQGFDAGVCSGGGPYLVMNDDHSGYYNVRYECERSWRLALAAVEAGVLSECEAMGFVHDLKLEFREEMLANLAARRGIVAGGNGAGLRAISRVRETVEILSRDRSNSAWCIGQLFLLETLMADVWAALSNEYAIRRQRQELERARQRDNVGSTSPSVRVEASDSELKPAREQETSQATEEPAATDEASMEVGGNLVDTRAAAERASGVILRRLHADVKDALQELAGHIGWHYDRMRSGEARSQEAIDSLRGMQGQVHVCHNQLIMAIMSFRVERNPNDCS